jgi:PAS domain S-box-containing protein
MGFGVSEWFRSHNELADRRRKDGTLIDASLSVSPIKDDAGQVTGASKIVRDITASKRTQLELAEKARLLDLTNDAVIVRDTADRVTFWNQGAEKLYGWRREEALGKDLHSMLHTEFPRPQEEIKAELHREGRFTGEVVQVARDGRRIPSLCRWVLDRKTESILTSYTDMSALKRAEEALRAAEKKYRTLFEAMDEGYCIIEVLFDEAGKANDWRYLDVNAAFERHNGITGALGKRMRELVPEIEPKWFEIYGKVALTGEAIRFVEHSPALHRWFDLYAYRVDGGESRKVAVLFTNITERKQAEAALRESEQRMRLATEATGVGIWE